MVKRTLLDQSVFCPFDDQVMYPVPGGRGRKGATFIELSKVKKSMLTDALTVSYSSIVSKGAAKKYSPK